MDKKINTAERANPAARAASQHKNTPSGHKPQSGGIYMYPKNLTRVGSQPAPAAIPPRYMHLSSRGKTHHAVMHQPNAAVPPMPDGYMRMPPALNDAAMADAMSADGWDGTAASEAVKTIWSRYAETAGLEPPHWTIPAMLAWYTAASQEKPPSPAQA